MNTTPKAYSYIRFSTPEQEKGDSLRRQRVNAKKFCEKYNLVLEKKEFIDRGVSGFRWTISISTP